MSKKKIAQFSERKSERTESRKLWKPEAYPTLFVMGCPNFTNGRYGCDIRWITLHHTYGHSADADITWFKISRGKKACSAHYVLAKNGTMYQVVKEDNTAWHAGFRSDKHGQANGHSIGIEITHRKGEFKEAQYLSLAYWLPFLCEKYNIPVKIFQPYGKRYAGKLKSANALKAILGDDFRGIIGHCTISKRSCPGDMFRWEHLAELLKRQGYEQ